MKLKKLKLENFRNYKDEVIIDIGNLTVFVGKNDIGKSTILEALDIFFNERAAVKNVDNDDLSKQAEEGSKIMVSVCFSDYPEKIIIDDTNETNLKEEYLLNNDEELEIKKVFNKDKLEDVFLIANHPDNDLAKDLLEKKIDGLKKIVNDNKIPCEDKTKKAELRKSIRNYYSPLELKTKEIPLKKEDAKEVWEKLKNYMPLYALFQSDRSNNDQDNEVQNPIKLAIKQILKNQELQNKFKEIAKIVEEKTKEITKQTLDKLKEMKPDIAKELKPVMPDYEQLKWADVFKKIDISSDNDVPLNKRGSGVKRLVLLNFFRAEVDRIKKENNNENTIYAFEEPETSQHVDHQKILINTFKELSKTTQILLTTHSPEIVKILEFKDLILIRKNKNNVPIIEEAEKINLPYKSLNEINYLAFDYIDEAYHSEIYGFIQEEYKEIFEKEIGKHEKKGQDGFLEYKNKKNGNTEYITFHKYIRNQIHHPENTTNKKFTREQLKESIKQMREYIKK